MTVAKVSLGLLGKAIKDGKTAIQHAVKELGRQLLHPHSEQFPYKGPVNSEIAVGVRSARQEVIRQKLILDNNNLPEYLAANSVYQS